MALVIDKSLGFPLNGALYRPFDSHNRKVTANPNASLTPRYVGEIVLWYDSVTTKSYRMEALDATNTGWANADIAKVT